MKHLNMFLAFVLAGTVAYGAQTSDLSIRDVRDPVTLRRILNENALDAENRLASVASFLANGTLSQSGLAIDANTNKFKTASTTYYTISGVQYSKAATTNLSFTAANTINVAASTNSAFYGAWLIEVNAAGTVATKPAGGLTNQVYTSAASAVAALPAPTAANVAIGRVTVSVAAGASFVANTTGMNTNTTTFTDAAIKTLP